MNPARQLDIMVAGAQKAGTTSLATALSRHPDVAIHESPEFPFFVDVDRFDGGYSAAWEREYRSVTPDQLVLAKSAGIMFLDDAAARLAQHNSRCRVVVALRHPVERAWSAYWYLRRAGRENATTFEEALDAESDRMTTDPATYHFHAYVGRGDYLPQLLALEKRFEHPIVVCTFDDLVANQHDAVAGVAGELGLDPEQFPTDEPVREHAAAQARSTTLARVLRQPSGLARRVGALAPPRLREAAKGRLLRLNERPLDTEPMAPATRMRLIEHFAPRNTALAEHLGRDLGDWDR